jgi:hypothetical protein
MIEANAAVYGKSLHFQQDMAAQLMHDSLGGRGERRGALAVSAAQNTVDNSAVAQATGKGQHLNIKI